MPTDKYTKFILTVIACGLLALVVQNAMGPLHLCNSAGCFEIKACDDGFQHFAGVCAHATGDRSTTTRR